LDKMIQFTERRGDILFLKRLRERRAGWDEKRKRVRALLKGYREVKS